MAKSAFRNKRRSILTVLSITFSLLLLTLMMTIWRAFYMDTFSAGSAQRLVTRHRVSLTQLLPSFYREKIRAIPGVLLAIFVAAMVGFLSAIFPAYHAARLDIVEGLRHIG